MLYFHKELKDKLKSDYQIQKAVMNKDYYKGFFKNKSHNLISPWSNNNTPFF